MNIYCDDFSRHLLLSNAKLNPTYYELNIDTIYNGVRILKQWAGHDWFIITGLFELKQTMYFISWVLEKQYLKKTVWGMK